jgi:hypothetical protein
VSASTYLGNLGISVQDARTFIMSHLDNPSLIFNTATQYGVTNEMLGEIVGGYSADQVESFFNSHGFNGDQLDAHVLLADDMMQLSNLISLDTHTGALSVASLRSQVIAQTGASAYQAAFSPDLYGGAADGVFTSTELGVNLGTLPATQDTMESLFYGTLINALTAIDTQEFTDLFNFIQTNGTALENGNLAVEDQFFALLVSVFSDVAATPMFAEAQIAETLVTAGTMLVQLIAHDPGMAMFDALGAAFLG